MNYISTRKKGKPLSASAAIMKGLASDGGLFIPEAFPQEFSQASQAKLENLSFPEFAAEILQPFFEGDDLKKKLSDICQKAFNFPLILKAVDSETSILELFHGPTNAFKDFGARFLAFCIDSITNQDSTKPKLVMVATSGDTGGAVAAAFTQCTKIPVAILYPKNKISRRQEKQLTSWGDQVEAFAVEGNFDDCQRIVKEAFLSEDWNKKYNLISANSINLARLLPQMCYFAYASLLHQKSTKQKVGFIIPSGNLGNAVAALWAQKMGFPIFQVVCAHNANQAVSQFFAHQVWKPLTTIQTLANAMDVGNPSNFERMKALCETPELLIKAQAFSVSDEEIKKTIIQVKNDIEEVVCPHTATAFSVNKKLKAGPWILIATAHPAKFEEIVEPLIGRSIDIPVNLQEILNKASKSITIKAELFALQKLY